MTRPTTRRRSAAALAAVTLTAAALAGCTPAPGEGGTGPTAGAASPAATTAPVSVVGGTRPEERLLARVVVRHLGNRGIPAALGEPSATPWEAAGDRQIAVVDSLAMAAELTPETLAGPVPTPSPSPSATGSSPAFPTAPASSPRASAATASPSGSASPTDPAPASPTGHPTATGSPTPLPGGKPAPDAAGTTAMVSEYFPEGTEVVGSSPGTLRLQAVTTTATAGLYGLEDITDLNGLCDRMVFTPRQAAVVEAERLGVLAGCVPAEWVEPGEDGPAVDVVTGRADVALLYGTDPGIADHALEPLSDPERVLPEGRVLLLAEPGTVPAGASAALDEVAQRLGGEQLAELQRLITGPDPLRPDEAAQYWLVEAGLEEAPDAWF